MHTIKSRLDVIVSEAMSQASGMAAEEINAQVIYATRPEFGDYQANGVMAIAKRLGKKPRDLAQEVVDAIPGNDLIAKLEIAGPGFINITLADEWLNKQASEYRIAPSNLIARLDSPQTIVVDYSSPNLAKEMHVGICEARLSVMPLSASKVPWATMSSARITLVTGELSSVC